MSLYPPIDIQEIRGKIELYFYVTAFTKYTFEVCFNPQKAQSCKQYLIQPTSRNMSRTNVSDMNLISKE